MEIIRRHRTTRLCCAAAARRWRLYRPALALALLPAMSPLPALAQVTGGGNQTVQTAPTQSGSAESLPSPPPAGTGAAGSEGPPTTSTGPAVAPANAGPEALPSLPQSGFGVASPIQSPSAVSPGTAAPPQPPSLRLPAPGVGITPFQRGQPGASAILIQPWIGVGETVTDNARNTPTHRVTDLETQLLPGISISADTPRLQGVLTGNLIYDKFIEAPDEDQLLGNFYANGTATAIPDHLFLDVKSAISQTSQFGAAGFAPISQLAKNQTTQVYTNTASPYFRESWDGLVDAELRYRFASTIFGGNIGTVQPLPLIPGVIPTTSTLSNSQSNDGTLTLATGRDFERVLSRLTVDAFQLTAAPGSVIPTTQTSAYDDLEYRIRPWISALGRLGYENIRYPFAPTATTSGALWQIGGRLGLGPDHQYVSLRYGKQQGIYGFTGSLYYEITPVTSLTAAVIQGVGSQQQQVGSNLVGSSLDLYGQLVDQYNLPTAFANPDFTLQNDVFRYYLYRASITTSVGINRLSLFGIYNRQVSLVLAQPPTTSFGANFIWARTIRPDLTAFASLGYVKTINQPLLTFSGTPAATSIPGQNTLNASLSLNYLLARNLTGSIIYSLFYQTNAQTSLGAAGIAGNVVTNRLEFLLIKSF